MASLKVEIIGTEDAEILVNAKPFYLSFSEGLMLDTNNEPMYDDAEDFIMHNMSSLDEDLVEEVVPQIAEKILPYIKQYLPQQVYINQE